MQSLVPLSDEEDSTDFERTSSAKPTRIDAFLKLIAPFGILESARTGLMALPRSPLHGPNEEILKDADEVVDASSLPPG